MYYDKKCDCCNAEFTIIYSGKNYSERLKKFNYKGLDSTEKSELNNLMLKIEKGSPWMAISMEEVPNIIKELQTAYKEYQKLQKELKKQGKLENSV